MVDIKGLKEIHVEFVEWLKTKKNIPRISLYIQYAVDYFESYERYEETKDDLLLEDIPRALNRYRDEFEFDSESIEQAYVYFDKMRKAIANEQKS